MLIDAQRSGPAKNASCARRRAEIRKLWCPGNIVTRIAALRDHVDRGRQPLARRNVAAVCRAIRCSSVEAKEVAMTPFVRPAWLALAFVATAMPASAQTWIYEPDVPRANVYEPRSYDQPRAYEAPVYPPRVVAAPPLALTRSQRTMIYRTIIPQGR
jgi:hypothetical protein